MNTDVIIVNENDEIIWYKPRADITNNDIYRVSAVVIMNSKREVLLAQRSFKKKNWPWKWSVSAAGTLERWDTYNSNIVKELEEELGLMDVKLKKVDKLRVSDGHNFFDQLYRVDLDLDISALTLQEEEVEAVRWFTFEEIKLWSFEGNEISPTLIKYLDVFTQEI